MNWNDPEQRRQYYRKWRHEHPGYGAAKMAAYRNGKHAKWIVASDFKRISWGNDGSGTVQRQTAEDRQAALAG